MSGARLPTRYAFTARQQRRDLCNVGIDPARCDHSHRVYAQMRSEEKN